MIELLRETGRMLFLRGVLRQDEATLASFLGTLREVPRPHDTRFLGHPHKARASRSSRRTPARHGRQVTERPSSATAPLCRPASFAPIGAGSRRRARSPARRRAGSGAEKGSILWRALGPPARTPPRGLYLWGRRRSWQVDADGPVLRQRRIIRRKRRVHFHEFMLEVHERLNEERRKNSRDPVVKSRRWRWPRTCACSPSTRWWSTTPPTR